jgi:hypothetical protein
MPRLSQELSECAIGMLQANMNVTTVARTLGCKRLAIHRLRRRFKMTGSTKDHKVVSLSMAVKVARAKVVKVCFDCLRR